ncbi:hypothetical protein [Phormidium sp. FACHB-1136]|nr:hypothetical protein [Phormidium sp. FACHB-1136]
MGKPDVVVLGVTVEGTKSRLGLWIGKAEAENVRRIDIGPIL